MDRLEHLENLYIQLLRTEKDGQNNIEHRKHSCRLNLSSCGSTLHLQSLVSRNVHTREPPANWKKLLYVHGTSASACGFASTMIELTDGNSSTAAGERGFDEVHAIDLPGFGRSECTDIHLIESLQTPEDIQEFYSDVLHSYIHTEMGTSDNTNAPVLMGHSFGGYLCAAHVSRWPHDVSALILVNPAGIFPLLGDTGNYWALFFKAQLPQSLFRAVCRCFPRTRRMLHGILDAFLQPSCSLSSRIFSHYYLELLCDPRVRAHAFVGRFIEVGWDGGSRWTRPAVGHVLEIERPLCFIYGELDGLLPAHQGKAVQSMADLLVKEEERHCCKDGSKEENKVVLHVIPGCGHAPYSDPAGMSAFCKSTLSFASTLSFRQLRNNTVDDKEKGSENGRFLQDMECAMRPFRGSYSLERTAKRIDAQYAAGIQACAQKSKQQ